MKYYLDFIYNHNWLWVFIWKVSILYIYWDSLLNYFSNWLLPLTFSQNEVHEIDKKSYDTSTSRLWYILARKKCNSRQRPYHIEHTSSRPITEVKQCWARLVLGWVTAWEHWVLLASIFFFFQNTRLSKNIISYLSIVFKMIILTILLCKISFEFIAC